jgi:hypothetical protein
MNKIRLYITILLSIITINSYSQGTTTKVTTPSLFLYNWFGMDSVFFPPVATDSTVHSKIKHRVAVAVRQSDGRLWVTDTGTSAYTHILLWDTDLAGDTAILPGWLMYKIAANFGVDSNELNTYLALRYAPFGPYLYEGVHNYGNGDSVRFINGGSSPISIGVKGNRYIYLDSNDNYINGYASSLVSNNSFNYVYGYQNVVKDLALFVTSTFGRANHIGDSTGVIEYSIFNGYGNYVYNNTHNLYYSSIDGETNYIFLNGNGFDIHIYGENNGDTAPKTSVSGNYDQGTYGNKLINRNYGSQMFGSADSLARGGGHYTSTKDETNYFINSQQVFETYGLRNAMWLNKSGHINVGGDTNNVDISGVDFHTKNGLAVGDLAGGQALGAFVQVRSDGKLVNGYVSTTGHLALSTQGIFPDKKRIAWVSTTAGSATITAPTGTFVAADSGKVIAIPKSRLYTAEGSDSLYTETHIKQYISSSSVVLDSLCQVTGVDSQAYFGTDWGNKLQQVFDYAVNNNIGYILFDESNGGYIICPKLSDSMKANGGYLVLRGGVHIDGVDNGLATIKVMHESDEHIDSAGYTNWGCFKKIGNGNVTISDLTIQSPDFNSHAKVEFYGNAIYSAGNFGGTLNVYNVNIVGDSDCKKNSPNWDKQWGQGIYITNNNTGYYSPLNVIGSNIYSSFQGIVDFVNDGKRGDIQELFTKIYYTGSPLANQTYSNCASISTGTNTLTISGISGFSFYYFTSTEGDYQKWAITLSDGVHSEVDTITSITSPTTCVLKHNVSNTYSSANLITSKAQGHAHYIHHNINTYFNHVYVYGNQRLACQLFSGNGLPDEADNHTFEYCGNYSYRGYGRGSDWILGHGDSSRVVLRSCDSFGIYGLGYPVNYIAYDCNFTDGYAYGQDTLMNCRVGGNMFIYKRAYIQGGYYRNIQLQSGQADSVYVRNADAGTLNNSNNTNGYFQISNTTAGTTTGSGTINNISTIGSLVLMSGTGTPEGNVTAGVGSFYLRTDGGTSTTLYIKESGTGNTGWIAK